MIAYFDQTKQETIRRVSLLTDFHSFVILEKRDDPADDRMLELHIEGNLDRLLHSTIFNDGPIWVGCPKEIYRKAESLQILHFDQPLQKPEKVSIHEVYPLEFSCPYK